MKIGQTQTPPTLSTNPTPAHTAVDAKKADAKKDAAAVAQTASPIAVDSLGKLAGADAVGQLAELAAGLIVLQGAPPADAGTAAPLFAALTANIDPNAVPEGAALGKAFAPDVPEGFCVHACSLKDG